MKGQAVASVLEREQPNNIQLQRKKVHQFTWECRSRGLNSIIDYFLVRREHMRRVRDVKVVRGAEVGSDHYLVLMKIQMRLVERRECMGNVGKEGIWRRMQFVTIGSLGRVRERKGRCTHKWYRWTALD